MEASDTTQNGEQQKQPAAPKVPQVDHMPETPEEVQALADSFAQFRKEVAALRNEIAASRGRSPVTHVAPESMQDRAKARLAAIAEHSHYCPGCGALYNYPQRCTGPVAQPHAPIEVVTTDELGGDPLQHTAAPSTDPDYQLAA